MVAPIRRLRLQLRYVGKRRGVADEGSRTTVAVEPRQSQPMVLSQNKACSKVLAFNYGNGVRAAGAQR